MVCRVVLSMLRVNSWQWVRKAAHVLVRSTEKLSLHANKYCDKDFVIVLSDVVFCALQNILSSDAYLCIIFFVQQVCLISVFFLDTDMRSNGENTPDDSKK